MFPDALSSPPIVAGAEAALKATAFELAGDEAASNAPMPAPLPKTSRPSAAIVTNPLPANALGAAMSSVPPLTVVPPVYAFVPLRVNSPLPEIANALFPMMFPAKVVVEPEDIATVSVGFPEYLLVTIAPAEPLRLPTVCGFPARSNTPPEAMVRAVAVGRFSPLPSSSSVPAEIVVGPLYVPVPTRSRLPAPIFVRATVPLVFWIAPLKSPLAPLAPTVSVQKPSPLLSTVPPPDSAPRWRSCR